MFIRETNIRKDLSKTSFAHAEIVTMQKMSGRRVMQVITT